MLKANSGALNSTDNDATRIAWLESELKQLRHRDAEWIAELAARERRIRLLEEALRIMTAERYGTSREKLTVAPGQSDLFNEAETLVELSEVLGTDIPLKATPQRVQKSGTGKAGRKAIAAHLPRVAIVHDLPESERLCACGSTLIEGADRTEDLPGARVDQIDATEVPPGIAQVDVLKTAIPGWDLEALTIETDRAVGTALLALDLDAKGIA